MHANIYFHQGKWYARCLCDLSDYSTMAENLPGDRPGDARRILKGLVRKDWASWRKVGAPSTRSYARKIAEVYARL